MIACSLQARLMDDVEVVVDLLDVLIPSGRHRHWPGTAAARQSLPVAAALPQIGLG